MAQAATSYPASTVVLVRPEPDGGFEIFMNRRPEKMDTYAGVYVFPGGRVEDGDWSDAMLRHVRGLSASEAQRQMSSKLQPEFCLGHWVAAVRELFEEAGVQLFGPKIDSRNGSSEASLVDRVLARRASVQRGEIGFSDLLGSEGLLCDLRRLSYFFHRVTPYHYSVRFDTRFFLAALPRGQTPLTTSEEVSESLWVTPNGALERHAAGGFPMMPPTLAVLRTLSGFESWSALLESHHL